jgi:hypothetical protein
MRERESLSEHVKNILKLFCSKALSPNRQSSDRKCSLSGVRGTGQVLMNTLLAT